MKLIYISREEFSIRLENPNFKVCFDHESKTERAYLGILGVLANLCYFTDPLLELTTEENIKRQQLLKEIENA